MKVTLSSDHRVIDGALAAQFLDEVRRLLENPDQPVRVAAPAGGARLGIHNADLHFPLFFRLQAPLLRMPSPPAPRVNRPFQTTLLVLGGFVWAGAVLAGFALLNRYKTEPAAQEASVRRWPQDTTLARSADRATLLLFAHPACPCTRASVSELARLMARASSQVSAQVVVVEPPDAPSEWTDSDLAARAAAIPGVTVVRDDGREAARFHAQASGFVVLYDASGTRLFGGGITASRGHEGDSFGKRRILAALAGETLDKDSSPVFGCALATHKGAHGSETP